MNTIPTPAELASRAKRRREAASLIVDDRKPTEPIAAPPRTRHQSPARIRYRADRVERRRLAREAAA